MLCKVISIKYSKRESESIHQELEGAMHCIQRIQIILTNLHVSQHSHKNTSLTKSSLDGSTDLHVLAGPLSTVLAGRLVVIEVIRE